MIEDSIFVFLLPSTILFAIGILGVCLNRRNIIMMLMSIELILLAASTNFIIFSAFWNDLTGQIFVFFILSVSASEVAVGLAIILNLYRCLGSIDTRKIASLKG